MAVAWSQNGPDSGDVVEANNSRGLWIFCCIKSHNAVIYLDWRRFRLAVALQLDLDLDSFILTPAQRGWKLMELLVCHSLHLIGREVGRSVIGAR
jgi:hypothetical protein